jgi:predicted lipoprotein with Yx(FWY)xxD motif
MTIRMLLVVSAAFVAASFPARDLAAPSSAPTVTVRGSDYGRILFDGGKRALYAFTRDPRGKASCYGACATAWPPYIVRGTLRAGGGSVRSLLGATHRKDGKRQLTYAGKPLYYYVHDRPGLVLCQNVREYGGLWLVVRPSGKLVR